MRKVFKKISLSLILIMLMFLLAPIISSEAKPSTLRQWRGELNKLEQKYKHTQNQQRRTQGEITRARNNVIRLNQEIQTNKKRVDDAKIEIEATNIKIAKAEDDIKDLMQNNQINSSGNMAMGYLFDAEDYADFVFRYAVAKRMTEYSANKIEEYDNLIEEKKELQVELAKREKEIARLITELQKEMAKNQANLKELDEFATDIMTDIRAARELISVLRNLGCGEDEDIEECFRVKGSAFFMRPLQSGRITSLYGWRRNPITGAAQSWHGGIDIGGNPEGTPVYSTASGTVSRILHRQSCGGNMVYIAHTVAGKKYTTRSIHLLHVRVKVGQQVTASTVIGTVGGGKQTTWDRCSTGAHLHFEVATGWYGISCSSGCYTLHSTYQANRINPRSVVNFPGLNGRFVGRV